VCADEQARISEGSKFQIDGAATLKAWKAKVVHNRRVDSEASTRCHAYAHLQPIRDLMSIFGCVGFVSQCHAFTFYFNHYVILIVCGGNYL